MDPSYVTSHPALSSWGHAFTERHPSIEVNVERAEALARLHPWHTEVVSQLFPGKSLRTAEQIHGAGVAHVTAASPYCSAGADALITADPSVVLGIYVADCCAVYLADERTGAVGLVHSGKKGTELRITTQHTLALMQREFGTRPQDVIAQLSPCIRPPAYEVDFAADIRTHCAEAGIPRQQIHDEGTCTSRDLQRFYSYRAELGKTGRMLALLAARD
jgi:polyphenol oxidase